MSIFPTKILLATDGSTEAELAARTAVDLSRKPTPNCTSYMSWTSPRSVSRWLCFTQKQPTPRE